MPLTIKIFASAALVMAVLWFMWRLPHRGDALDGWAPPLALLSAWLGLAGVVMSALLWVLPYPDRWITLLFLLLDPAAIAAGVLVLWIYRGRAGTAPTIDAQCLQARVGVALGIAAVAIGYIYVISHKAPGTPVGV